MSDKETGASAQPGLADLHIHTLASDGVSSVADILDAAVRRGLDVIAVADHERVDAAHAAQRLARELELDLEVIVGEEITTRGGHLVGLGISQRIRPWGALKSSVARVHEQGGLAIIAHPLVPYPLCASAGAIQRLLDEADPIFHPDAIEVFNPTTARMRWSRDVPGFARSVGLPGVAGSDAHRAADVGHALTTFPGRTADDVLSAIRSGTTGWQGTPYTWRKQFAMFVEQQRKNARAISATARHRLLGDGTGRDLGYPRT
jgi:predicted metal-dependent phosphoesterase TrpH